MLLFTGTPIRGRGFSLDVFSRRLSPPGKVKWRMVLLGAEETGQKRQTGVMLGMNNEMYGSGTSYTRLSPAALHTCAVYVGSECCTPIAVCIVQCPGI